MPPEPAASIVGLSLVEPRERDPMKTTSHVNSLRSLFLFIVAGCVTVVPAPRRPAHPAYLHALADLRDSRAHLERAGAASQTTAWDENVAIHEIDAAIGEIRQASIDDGKPLNDHPPVDVRLD